MSSLLAVTVRAFMTSWKAGVELIGRRTSLPHRQHLGLPGYYKTDSQLFRQDGYLGPCYYKPSRCKALVQVHGHSSALLGSENPSSSSTWPVRGGTFHVFFSHNIVAVRIAIEKSRCPCCGVHCMVKFVQDLIRAGASATGSTAA